MGEGEGGDDSHLNPTNVQLTPKLDDLIDELRVKSDPCDLISTLLDGQNIHVLRFKMAHNSLRNVTISDPLGKIANLEVRAPSHMIFTDRHDKRKKLSPDGRGTHRMGDPA